MSFSRFSFCQTLAAGTVMLSCGWSLTLTRADEQSTGKPLYEVRHGGYHQQQPHKAVIQVFSDGRVVTLKGVRQADPSELAKLTAQLKGLTLFDLNQKQLDSEIKASGEPPPGTRGGSGVVTLVFHHDTSETMVSLNRPDAYQNSKVAAAQTFVRSWNALKKFADGAK